MPRCGSCPLLAAVAALAAVTACGEAGCDADSCAADGRPRVADGRPYGAIVSAAAVEEEAHIGLHLLQSQTVPLPSGLGGGRGKQLAVPVVDATASAKGGLRLTSSGRTTVATESVAKGLSVSDGLVSQDPLDDSQALRLHVLQARLLQVHDELRKVLPSISHSLDKVESAVAAAAVASKRPRRSRGPSPKRLQIGNVELQISSVLGPSEVDPQGESGDDGDYDSDVSGNENKTGGSIWWDIWDDFSKVSNPEGDSVRINGPVNVRVEVLQDAHHPSFGSVDWWIIVIAAVVLVLFAGLMSGLSIGLLSFQPLDLEIIARSATDEQERQNARKLQKVIADQHLLLVTLLICNAGAMEALPVLLDDLMSPMSAVLLSVTAVLLFGEIIPQALCKSFGLRVGATTAPIVHFLMVICYPIAWPIGKILDAIFGCEKGALYRRAEMASLVTLQKEHGILSENEALVIEGALAMGSKRCASCMKPMREVATLRSDAVLNEATMDYIVKSGHSRFPVLDERGKIVGLLLPKKLVKVRPEDATPIKNLHLTTILHVSEDTHLFDALEAFQKGRSQVAAVYRSTSVLKSLTVPPESDSPLGIITVSDVIEELIRSEFPDERTVDTSLRHAAPLALPFPAFPAQTILENTGRDLDKASSHKGSVGAGELPGLVAVLRRATAATGTRHAAEETRGASRLGSFCETT